MSQAEAEKAENAAPVEEDDLDKGKFKPSLASEAAQLWHRW